MSTQEPAKRRVDDLASQRAAEPLPAPPGNATPIPLTTAEALRGHPQLADALLPRDRGTAAELERLDPQLAGLFRLGLELIPRASEPGVPYLIGHAGRELARGVVRLLAETVSSIPAEEAAQVEETERNRATIAQVLQLSPEHASVDIWFTTQRAFVDASHFRSPGRSSEAVRAAFLQFAGLLFGRVAPYFSTHADLNALLAVAEPTPDDVARAQALLLRPVQRAYFFRELRHPAWLSPLATAGHFDTPPELTTDVDGTQRTRSWPEGEFLVRAAPLEPDRVLKLLLAIPRQNASPVVWDVVVRAALALPPRHARKLVPAITQAMRTVPAARAWSRRAIELVRALASADECGAFGMAEGLLWLSPGPAPGEMIQVDEYGRPVASLLPHLGGGDTEWMLLRLDAYQLGKFLAHAVPALEALDPVRTLALLAQKLAMSARLGKRADADRDHRFQRLLAGGFEEEAEGPAATTPADGVDGDSVPSAARDRERTPAGIARRDEWDNSQFWCDRLTHADEAADVRRQFAVAVTAVATRLATRDPAGAERAIATLHRHRGDVFTRIRLHVLTAAGPSAQAAAQEALDDALTDPNMLDPPFGGREVAAFLREQFDRASDAAQAAFAAALERGPAAEVVALAAVTDDRPATPASEHAVVAEWQRRRLRWFHDRIPARLAVLASAVGVEPSVPSHREQALDEDGYYTTVGARSVPRVSPVDVAALAAMTPEQIVAYLCERRPGLDAAPDGSGGSVEGLEATIRAFVAAHSEPAAAVARLIPGAGLPPGYVVAVLAGFEDAVEEQRPLPWSALGPLLEFTRREAATAAASESVRADDLPRWRSAAERATRVLRDACANDVVTAEHSEDVWRLADEVARSTLTWAASPDSGTSHERTSLSDLAFAALNSPPGHAVRTVVDVALWDYRRLLPPARARDHAAVDESGAASGEPEGRATAPVDASQTAHRLTPLLDEFLAHASPEGRAALAILGQLIPQLMLLAPRWVLEHADELFAGGADRPLEHPAWGAYLAGGGLYGSVFVALRPWYGRAADAAPDPSPASETSDWSVSRNLAGHVLRAVVRGWAALGNDDGLVERAFTRVRAADRARAYWTVFRGWSDASSRIPDLYVRRLLAFWEWRVDQLERSVDGAEQAAVDDAEAEAEGLEWFILTPQLPAAAVVPLALRTMRLGSSRRRASSTALARLGELATANAAGTYEIVELLARQALAREYGYLPFEYAAPALRSALASNAGVAARARRLIHELGERGHLEFGTLLESE